MSFDESRRFIALTICCLLLSSCGGGSDNPGTRTLTSLKVSPASVSVSKGLTQQFMATGTYSDGSTASVTNISWASTSTSVATIGMASGLAQAIAVGSTTITASSGPITSSAMLSVVPAAAKTLVVQPTPAGDSVGANIQLQAIEILSDGTDQNVTAQATWKSSDPSVATVGATTGLVTGIAPGTAKISAVAGTFNASSAVTIVTATWAETGSLSVGRDGHNATLLQDGKVLVTGGVSGYVTATLTTELYDPAVGTWTPSGNLTTSRYRATATLLPNGKVLIAGGVPSSEEDGAPVDTAEIYDPATGSSSATGSMLTPRWLHSATLLANGKVLVAGGATTGAVIGGTGPSTSSAELFDPATGTWSFTGNMVQARAGQAAVLLQSGKVLVVGSTPTNDNAQESAEVYDPVAQSWAPTGNLAVTGAVAGATALLANGSALMVGGVPMPGGILSPVAELYQPSTNTWTVTGSPDFVSSSVTRLATGMALIADAGQISSELYDPSTGSWTPNANLTVSVSNYTATLLQTGQVLVAGGDLNGPPGTGTPNTRVCQLYTP